MAITGYTPFPTSGNILAMQAQASNPGLTIQSSVTQGIDQYAALLDVVSGANTNYIRLTERNSSTGITKDIARDEWFMQIWIRFGALPGANGEDILIVQDTVDFVSIAALRVKANGSVHLQDLDDLSSATNTASSAAGAITAGTWYRLRFRMKSSTGTADVLVYNEAGTLTGSIAATGCNFGVNQAARVYLGWGASFQGISLNSYIGDASATFSVYYGMGALGDTDYPDANIRVGTLRGTAAGFYTGFTPNTGTTLTASQSDNGNTAYNVSTTANEAMTFAVQNFAQAGISASSILAFSPFGVYWDVGGAVTIATRARYASTNYDTTLTDPGPNVDFHLRGILYTTHLDGSAITQAKIEATEVGCVRNNATTEVRCGSCGIHVVYVPVVSSARVDLDRIDTSRLRGLSRLRGRSRLKALGV